MVFKTGVVGSSPSFLVVLLSDLNWQIKRILNSPRLPNFAKQIIIISVV